MQPLTVWLVSALLVAIFLVVLVIELRQRALVRRKRRAGQIPLRYPLVLVHGFGGFDEMGFLGWRQAYFRGIANHLAERGLTIYRPRIPAMATISERAAALAEFVEKLDAAKITIIGHSMGALDARYAIARLGLARRVVCLVSIGSPHHGTPLASIGSALLRVLRRAMGSETLSANGVECLTPERMAQFNREIEDAPGVRYLSVVGVVNNGDPVNPALAAPLRYLRYRAGPSDGLVPARSQVWGEVLWEINADHYAQVGWSTSFDARTFYERLAEELYRRGY